MNTRVIQPILAGSPGSQVGGKLPHAPGWFVSQHRVSFPSTLRNVSLVRTVEASGKHTGCYTDAETRGSWSKGSASPGASPCKCPLCAPGTGGAAVCGLFLVEAALSQVHGVPKTQVTG